MGEGRSQQSLCPGEAVAGAFVLCRTNPGLLSPARPHLWAKAEGGHWDEELLLGTAARIHWTSVLLR